MGRVCSLIFLMVLFKNATAQTQDLSVTTPRLRSYTFTPDFGKIIVHTYTVRNTAGTSSLGFSLRLADQQISQRSYDNCGCYPLNGLELHYFHFTNQLLGNGVALDYFLEPVVKISDTWQFQFRGAAGLSYLTNPDDSITNLENRNYSTHINSFLELGTGLGYRLNSHLLLEGDVTIRHVSNGSFKHPNAGINWVSGAVSLVYSPRDNSLKTFTRHRPLEWKHRKPWVDIGLYYVPPQGYYYTWQVKRYYIAGAFAEISRQISPVDAVNFGLETYYNNISVLEFYDHYDHNNASFISGVMAGHAFIFGKVYFSQQLGLYLTTRPSYLPAIYQRYGLSYQFTKHFLAGVNLKTHGASADFVDLRVIYRR